ncbi:MAG TPA: A/G-specific adenine glycosylase [Elusimicrobia bacterium]|nr:A/G-specific adenine glycosylase [Elusimicrobiota bacterium]
MLQQTTIAAVLPRYEKFLTRFPDLRALAKARVGSVLRQWAGLGYYSRARNMHAAARKILAQHNGIIPRDEHSLRALPGVGPYTAAALLSIAYNQPAAVLDGNVKRVLCRLDGVRGDVRRPRTQSLLLTRAQNLIDPRHPGDWNQALMELGETICTPSSPRCGDCPARKFCAALKMGLQDQLPRLGPRPKPAELKWTCLWIEDRGRVLLWKRSHQELVLKSHWGLPEVGQVRADVGRVLKAVRHAITRYRITLTVRQARLVGPKPSAAAWMRRDRLKERLVSSLWLKALPDKTKRTGQATPASSSRTP